MGKNVSEVPPSPGAAQDGLGAAPGEGGTQVTMEPLRNFILATQELRDQAWSNNSLKPTRSGRSGVIEHHAVACGLTFFR